MCKSRRDIVIIHSLKRSERTNFGYASGIELERLLGHTNLRILWILILSDCNVGDPVDRSSFSSIEVAKPLVPHAACEQCKEYIEQQSHVAIS